MATEIVNLYKESFPDVRFIGKRYLDGDRDVNGSFGPKWDEWMENQWFDPLLPMAAGFVDGDATLGFMQFAGGVFEYWIGLFCAADSPVPGGYQSFDLHAASIATCWVKGGMESGEIFGEEPCMQGIKAIEAKAWRLAPDSWFYERYVDSRFLQKDDEGKVVLDYCFHLSS